MSRTKKKERGLGNPVEAYVSYKPNDGEFVIYHTNTKKKETVKEIDIMILDADRFSLSGYSAEHGTGYKSDYVFNSRKESFQVGVFNNGKYNEVAKGLYQDIKDDLEGIKYTKPVFGLLKVGDDRVMAELELTGMAKRMFMDWFMENEDDAYAGTVVFSVSDKVHEYIKKTSSIKAVSKSRQKKWMTTWFFPLEFSIENVSDEEDQLAEDKDKELQKWFASKGNGKPETEQEDVEPSVPEGTEEEEDDDLPF